MSCKHYLQAQLALKQLGMFKASSPSSISGMEAIIKTQFRQELTIDEWYETYIDGAFTEYLTGRDQRRSFYATRAWMELRGQVLRLYGKRCLICGSSKEVSVDHIISRFKDPSRELDITNCQVLCLSCNVSKSSNTADYRRQEDMDKLRGYLEARSRVESQQNKETEHE